MSEKVLLISNGEEVFAIPTEICEKYSLAGDKLANAQTFLKETSEDVEGQARCVMSSAFPMVGSCTYEQNSWHYGDGRRVWR